MDRLNEARAVIERLRAISPNAVSIPMRYSRPEQRELYLSGWRVATGEE